MLDWLSSWLFVKRFRRVLTFVQSSVKTAPLRDFNSLFHVSNSFATLEDFIPCSCRDSVMSTRLQSGMTTLSEISHSLRGIIGLVPIVNLIVDHSVVCCCLIKHDTLHLSISRTTPVESHPLGQPFTCLNCLFFLIIFPLCLSFWTPVGIDLNLLTGAMRSLRSRSLMSGLSRDIASI